MHGILPEGVHDCSLEEIRQRFTVDITSQSRSQLWTNLQTFIVEVKALGLSIFVIYVDGGFISDKIDTKDIDVAIELPPKDRMRGDSQLANSVKVFLNRFSDWHEDWVQRLGIDSLPNIPPVDPWENDFTQWFQYINPKDMMRLGLSHEDRKGILRVII